MVHPLLTHTVYGYGHLDFVYIGVSFVLALVCHFWPFLSVFNTLANMFMADIMVF
jgi:hypothetical protein